MVQELGACLRPRLSDPRPRKTEVSIHGEAFRINGRPTYEGGRWHGQRIEGLLLNARMVQGIFDDLNPETRPSGPIPTPAAGTPSATRASSSPPCPSGGATGCWPSPSTSRAAVPQGYSKGRSPGTTRPSRPRATLRPAYMARLEKILDRADELGMVVILGVFYFGQDERLRDEAAVVRGRRRRRRLGARPRLPQRAGRDRTTSATSRYDHADPPARAGPRADRAGEARSARRGRRLLRRHELRRRHGAPRERRPGRRLPADARQRRERSRADRRDGPADAARAGLPAHADPVQRGRPLRFRQAAEQHRPPRSASTPRGATSTRARANYRDGYQCPPVNWQINTARKRAFFAKVAEVSGMAGP